MDRDHPVFVLFAAIDNVDRSMPDWERKVVEAANNFYFVPKTPDAKRESMKRVEEAVLQIKERDTVPEWMVRALNLLHSELYAQAAPAHLSPSPQ